MQNGNELLKLTSGLIELGFSINLLSSEREIYQSVKWLKLVKTVNYQLSIN